jgi:type I restriction enzyme S subunit
MRPLRDVLRERRETLSLNDGLGDWQAITVKFSGEVIQRERDRAFKGAMFAAYSGDLLFSKIDARNGAVGLIPASIPKVVVTTEYPVLIPDPATLRPAYLHHLMRAEHFKADLQRKASGTSGRKRVTSEGFLGLVVPVPELADQDALVSAYSAALDHAARLEQEAQTVEDAGVRAFETALGVVAPPPLLERPVFVARFRDIERWSHEGILRASTQPQTASVLWPMAPLGTVGKVTYGIQKCPANRPGTRARPYLRVANVQRNALDLREIKYINVPDEEMPKLRLEPGDLLLCEGNSAELVGRGAIWSGEIEDCVHQNHVLRVRLDQTKLLPEFVLAIINSGHGQAYFRSKAKRTTNLASINSKEVAGLPIPLLLMDDQRKLLCELENSTSLADTKRTEAQTLRASAWTAFESALFATDDLPEGRRPLRPETPDGSIPNGPRAA